MRARCADGPYVGRTFEFPYPEKIHWKKKRGMPFVETPTGPLMWIVNGADHHCYQLVQNCHNGDWRLVYRDTFGPRKGEERYAEDR